MKKEAPAKASSLPSRLWYALGSIALLSSILKYAFLGDVSAVLVITIEWYRWLTSSILCAIGIDLPDLLVDIQVFLFSIFFGVIRLNPHYKEIFTESFTGKGLDLVSKGREKDEKLFRYLFMKGGKNYFVMTGWNEPIWMFFVYILGLDFYYAFLDGSFNILSVFLTFYFIFSFSYYMKCNHRDFLDKNYAAALLTEIFSFGIFGVLHFCGLLFGLAIAANLRLVAFIGVTLVTIIAVAVLAQIYFDPLLTPFLDQYPRPPARGQLPAWA